MLCSDNNIPNLVTILRLSTTLLDHEEEIGVIKDPHSRGTFNGFQGRERKIEQPLIDSSVSSL